MQTNKTNKKEQPGGYNDQQAVDKAPGEERGRKEKVTLQDLKGKKVDADLLKESGKPKQNPK